MSRRICSAFLILLLSLAASAGASEGTLLLRQPALSAEHLAFVYAGDLWISDREGQNPRRLTSDPAEERRPHFSPNGEWIAFTAEYGGNIDVHVIPAAGGTARRLTWHPGDDEVSGWSADGQRVTFSSAREVGSGRSGQLYEVGLEGGLPRKVMEAPFFRGAWNGDALAYMAFGPAYNGLYGGSAGWRGYRGGTTPSIHILNMARNEHVTVPGDRVNDMEPRWDGGNLYFLSDRDDKVFNVYRYAPASGAVERLSNETQWDVRSVDVRDGTVVYEAGGRLRRLDTASGQVRDLTITLTADLPGTRAGWKNAADSIESVGISPSGKRALITARGEVFTVPTKHGSTRNLTTSDGVREYTALWSPDGGRVAYLVDDGAAQSVHVVDQAGLEQPRTHRLGERYYTLLAWSGDGSHLAYSDNRLGLHLLRLSDGRSRRIATHEYREEFDVASSPDGRWLAFTQAGTNLYKNLMLYEMASGNATRLSDGMADVTEVAFSPDGRYLYFGASTNSGQTQVGLDLSSQERPTRMALYAVVLPADARSPVAPRTGDENDDGDSGDDSDDNGNADDEKGRAKPPPPTRVDLDGIQQRIVAIPVPARNYVDLQVDHSGDLFYVDQVQPGSAEMPADGNPAETNALRRFDFEAREEQKVADGITAVTLSHGGTHLLARNAKDELMYAEVKDDMELEKLDTSGLRLRVDPRREWAQIFRDAWRMEREFFYAENLHGLDWDAVYERYRPLLEHAGRREDVNDLLVQMIAELHVGHNRVGGGDVYKPEPEAKAGLLGADLRIENGRYRIREIYDAERWNPFLHAPLARPGLNVRPGDYVLAVNGQTLTAEDNIFAMLQGTVDKQVHLRVSAQPDGRNARTVVVVPTADERVLRLWHWVERNRRTVEQASDGRVGYVYLPNTAGEGYTFFNRMFFAQVDKQALVIDERSNGGGQAANYITDVLSRTYLAGWKDRDGRVFDTPGGAVYGPKVMLIDQDAGSGGDFLPYAFRHMGLGKLIGTRTWGGLIGIAVNPPLMDGGFLVVPYFRFFTPEGEWAIENEGVAPDIEVALDPVRFNAGEDVQLQRAVDEVLRELESYEPVRRTRAPPLPTQLGM